MRLQVNSDQCSGCRLCIQICAMEKFEEVNPKKARLRLEARFPEPGGYRPFVCTECGICRDICPGEAIGKNERDVLQVSEEGCIDCGACVEACPEGVMMRRGDGAPFKCDFCGQCTEVCNTGALTRQP
ncbi:MAG: 4Fe-4S binding protein [Smithellaceae bacterium]|nr:4Fe-4S binding protein [Smithellaceae bacterium]